MTPLSHGPSRQVRAATATITLNVPKFRSQTRRHDCPHQLRSVPREAQTDTLHSLLFPGEAQRSLGDPGPDWPEQGRKMCTKLQGFVAILSTRQKSMVWPVPGDAQEERGWERGCSTRANSKSKVERQKLLSEHRGQFKILN